MTDREALFNYRLREAEETLNEAARMIEGGFTPRTIINRAYYAMFYAVLALFIRFDTQHRTSKHSGVIGIFNKEFVRTGKVEVRIARMLSDLFDVRLEGDYKDFVELTQEQAKEAVAKAQEFLSAIKELIAAP